MQNLTETTGQRIALLREQAKIKQSELAKMLGVKPNIISYYENDVRIPSIEIIIQLAKIFDVTTDYLLCVSDNKKHVDTNIGERFGMCDEAIGFLDVLTKNAYEGEYSKSMLFIFNEFFKQGEMEYILDDIVDLMYFAGLLENDLRNEHTTVLDERLNYNINMLELKTYQLQKNYGEYIEHMLGVKQIWELYGSLLDNTSKTSDKDILERQLDEVRQNIFIAQYMKKEQDKEGADNANDTQEG